MSNITNKASLYRLATVLMSFSMNVMESVKVKGHELSVQPFEGKKGDRVTIALLRNGVPTKDVEALDEMHAKALKLLEREHPSVQGKLNLTGDPLGIKIALRTTAAREAAHLRKERKATHEAPPVEFKASAPEESANAEAKG